MQNSIRILVDRVDSIKEQIIELKTSKPSKVNNLRNMLESALHKLNTFGTRYNVIEVKLTVAYGTGEQERILYYTDITKEEAIDYVLLRSQSKIIRINATELPVGKPLIII